MSGCGNCNQSGEICPVCNPHDLRDFFATPKCLKEAKAELERYPGVAADVSGCGCPACLREDEL